MSHAAAVPFVSGFSADPMRSATLPAYWYYDPAIHAAEREGIFFRTWQFAGLLADLPNPGSYFAATVLDQPVFVIRNRAGELRAYYNACSHRGHTLVEGRGEARLLTCPFHAWTFDADGNLRAAGNAENVAGFDPADFGLTSIRVETFLHMVFVNLDGNAPSLASQAGGLESYVREHVFRFDELRFARRDTIPIAANWKFVFDGLECYHCPVIHPEAMQGSDYETREGWHESIYSIHRTPPRRGTGPDDLLFRFTGKEGEIPVSYVFYLWPNMMFMARRGEPNFAIAHAMPDGIERTVVTIDHFYLSDPPTEANVRSMNAARDIIWPQDTLAMAKQQIGVKARGFRQGRLMVDAQGSWRSEHTVHHFEKLVWDAVLALKPDADRLPAR